MERYHWSLYELDLTDIESLIPFVLHAGEMHGKAANGKPPAKRRGRRVYADQVDWM